MTDRPDYAGIRATLLEHRRLAEEQIAGLRERVRAIDEALTLLPERRRRRKAATIARAAE
jgi:hypothetical protein